MKKTMFRFLAVLLGIVVLSSAFAPFTAAAEGLSATETSTLTETQTKEVTVLREEFVKHFELPDGTGAAVVYDSPVHYEKDGNWVEIDNTLVSAIKLGDSVNSTIVKGDDMSALTDMTKATVPVASTTAYYENRDNPFRVQLPAVMHKNAPIAVTHGEHTLRFCFDGVTGRALGAVEQPFTKQEQSAQLRRNLSAAPNEAAKVEVDTEHAMTAWKNRSAISFSAVQPQVDLQYHMNGQKLKEALIFHQIPTALSFSFTFTYTGLEAILQADNRVLFVDSADTVAFVIDAPYMFDNGDGYSTDIAVAVQTTATGCRYTLTPDRGWLTDSERVYPVTLDPTTSIPATRNDDCIQDAGVQQSNPTTNYQLSDRIYVGSGPNSTRGCLYFNLLNWPALGVIEPSRIIGANLRLTYYPTASWQTGHDFTIDAYRLTSAWDPATITWNNSANIYGTYMSSVTIDDARQKVSGYDSYDITNWVLGHYAEPSTDFGIRLQPATVSSTINRVCYVSSDYSSLYKRPLLIIGYSYKYELNLQHYYDNAFRDRCGNDIAANDKIESSMMYIRDYFLSQYTIKISHSISAYQSPADLCPCGKDINSICQNAIPTNENSSCANYHCTNSAKMLYTPPAGVNLNTLDEDTIIIKWTGHIPCEFSDETPRVHGDCGASGICGGTQILICLGNRNYLADDSTCLFTCHIAHELGHSLGCPGDGDFDEPGTCVQYAMCIMQYNVDDSIKFSNIRLLDANGYCNNCDDDILSYANQYLQVS